jgi:uncharacterized protein
METRWALVTGASSGLGIEFAAQLASRNINLILTARSESPLRQLSERLRRDNGIEVVVEPLDLGVSGSAAELASRLQRRGVRPEILINNAGFGLYEAFMESAPERLNAMLQLDVVSLVELTQIFGRQMVANGSGRILLVGSMAAYQPVPLMAAYAAAKAFVLSFGEALHVELAPKVTVTVLSPGLMDTGFNKASGYESPKGLDVMKLLPADVARIGLEALFAGKSGVIAGRLNKVMAFSSRLLSRHLIARAAMPKPAEKAAERR